METRVSKLLGTKYPVIQGGMAWVAEYHLAAAVSNAGGLGIIGAASAPPEVVREQIREAKKLTDKPFGVNVMLLNPNAAEVAQIVIEEGVKVVTTGAGNPGKFMDAWKQAGVVVIPVVASVAMARMMERGGADAVIAEGMESGGHIGAQTTMTLVPQVQMRYRYRLLPQAELRMAEVWRRHLCSAPKEYRWEPDLWLQKNPSCIRTIKSVSSRQKTLTRK